MYKSRSPTVCQLFYHELQDTTNEFTFDTKVVWVLLGKEASPVVSLTFHERDREVSLSKEGVNACLEESFVGEV